MGVERDINVRVKILDDGSVVLETIGKQGKESFGRIEKGSKKAGKSIGLMNKNVAEMATGFAVAELAMDSARTVMRGFKKEAVKGFESVEDFNLSVATMTGFITTFSQKTADGDLAGGFIEANAYAKELIPTLEVLDAKTIATGKDLKVVAETMMMNGTLIDINNQRQVDGLLRIVNVTKMLTAGQNQDVQFRQEINALMTGQLRMTDRLPKMLDAAMKRQGKDLRENLELWKAQGTLIENVGNLLAGFGETTELIEETWTAIGSTMETIHTRVLRGGMKPIYEDILDIAENVNRALMDTEGHMTPLAINLQETMHAAWDLSKDASTEIVDFFEHFGPAVKYLGGALVTATVAQWAFNKAAKANPYLLGATALFWVSDWFADYIADVNDAVDATEKLNKQFNAITGAPAPSSYTMNASHGNDPQGSDAFLAAVDREKANNSQHTMRSSHGVPDIVKAKAPEMVKGIVGIDKDQIKLINQLRDNLDDVTRAALPEHERAVHDVERAYADLEELLPDLYLANRITWEDAIQIQEDLATRMNESLAKLEATKRGQLERLAKEQERVHQQNKKSLEEVTRSALPEHERAVHDVHQAYADLSAQVDDLLKINDISKEVGAQLKENLTDRMNEDLSQLAQANLDEMQVKIEEITRASLPEQERAVHDIKQAYVELNEQVEELYKLGEISKDIADQFHEDFAVRMKEDVENLSDTFSDKMENAITGWATSYSATLNDMLWESEFTFNGILESFGRMLTEMMLQEYAMQPLLESASGDGGWINSIGTWIGGMFGGGRETGGPVGAGMMYDVNETGDPELLSLPGRTLLLMGDQSGQVIPLPAGGASAGSTASTSQNSGFSVNIINKSKSEVSTRQTSGSSNGGNLDIILDEKMAHLARGNGRFSRALRDLGLKPGLTGR